MKITSLKVGKIKSFGPEQNFEDFSNFNLFIGKNGTGKTNTLKLLCGLPIEFKVFDNLPGAYYPLNLIDLSDFYKSDIKGFGGIIYTLEIEERIIELKFENKDGFRDRIITGDVNLLKHIKIINSNTTLLKDLMLDLRLFCTNSAPYIPLFSFGISYVLGMDFSVQFNNDYQIHITNGNITNTYSFDQIESFSSGQLFCINSVMKIISNINLPILIDEPEGTLEPRAIRRLFQFMAWLCFKNNTEKSTYELQLESSIKSDLNNWWNIIQNRHNLKFSIPNEKFPFPFFNPRITFENREAPKITIEEANLGQNQIFIASHAPVLINEFMKFQNKASIYEFRNELYFLDKNSVVNSALPLNKSYTHVRKVNSNLESFDLLDDLGCKGSDILQTNGVIWVEGPSDIIFISKWLEMYAIENNLKVLIQGKDFEFQMFGGALLDSICIFNDTNRENEFDKIVQIFSFSRNAYVITDSDAVVKEGVITDISTFSKAKTYIRDQFKELNGNRLGIWYDEGNAEIRTIEDYLDEDSKKGLGKPKKKCAIKIINGWIGTKKISDFDERLEKEISNLYKSVSSWND